jgi:hypothetical protein
MRKPGRPMGPVLIAVLDQLRLKPMTAREVARETLLSVGAAKNACQRLYAAELIVVHKKIEVNWSNKRVSVFIADNRMTRHPAMMVASGTVGTA